MRLAVAALATFLLGAAAPALGQEVSEGIKRSCRSLAEQTARTISYAVRANIDPATRVQKVAGSWQESVQNHMLLAASRAPYLTEPELAALGYSYCVERRPSNAR